VLDLKIGKVYTFQTTAPAILGTSVKNARLMGMLDYATASGYEMIDLKYRSIYPLLPPGTPDTPELSVYYRFQSESGEKIILADIWIQESTVEIVDHIDFQVIFTRADISDITKVKNAINALGYMNFQIKQL
jgi:hypothetical protein